MVGVYRRKDSSKWWINYRLDGELKRQVGGATKREAAQLLAKIKTEIYNGTHFPDRQHNTLTLSALRDRWLKQAESKKSFATDRQRFETIVNHFGPSTLLTALRQEDIAGFKASMARQTTRNGTLYKPSTINRHIALLKAALNFAVLNQHLQRSPMLGIKMLHENNHRDRICDDEELTLLTQNAEPGLRLAIIIAHNTGMRMGEISALTWSDIDMKGETIRIRGATTKTGEGREIPLDDVLKAELEKVPRSLYGRLFRVDCRTWSPSFKRLCKKLGINDLRFHDLRHTAATRWRRAGVDLFTIASLTGHKDLATLRRYNTITLEDKRKAMLRTQKS